MYVYIKYYEDILVDNEGFYKCVIMCLSVRLSVYTCPTVYHNDGLNYND